MKNEIKMGKNRTGLQMSPKDGGKMLEGSDRTVPTSDGDEVELAKIRAPYISEADGLGSVPPPGTVKGVFKAGAWG